MAPKWHWGESSQPQSLKQYDKKRFMSLEAFERYHNVIAGKKLIQERGLQPDATESGQLATMIVERR